MKPIAEMKTDPYGLPLMGAAWFGLIVFLATKPEVVAEFEKDTGHSMEALTSKGIAQMIDEATGRTRLTVIAWCDWVTENYWGTEDEDMEAPQ